MQGVLTMKKFRSQEGLDAVDQSKLRNNNYEQESKKWPTVFVIRHKNAELHASSLVHACNLIGWRPRQVELIDQYKVGSGEK
jgi:hypothetical protein